MRAAAGRGGGAPMTVPPTPARDLRLDVMRGWMQVSIFVSHIVGTGLFWGIHATWGLSDSSEQFVFLSGLGLGSVFALKSVRQGFAGALRDLTARLRRVYVMHVSVVAVFAALVFWADARLAPGEVERLHWTLLAEAPAEAVLGLLLTLHQPDFTGILPVFVWCMALLPAFMWLAGRIGAWALLPPAAGWASVQLFGLEVPGLGGTPLEFNPFAWTFLFLLGAWFGRQKLLTGRALPARAWMTWAAAAVVLFGLHARLVGHGIVPEFGPGAALLEGKTELAPLRLLHALALAWLVARLLPREAGWMQGRPGWALAAIGRNSLPVFCLGLFLSWGAGLLLRCYGAEAWWLDPMLVAAGIAALALFAARMEQGAARSRAATGRAR